MQAEGRRVRRWPMRLAGFSLVLFVAFLLGLTLLAQRDFRQSYAAQQQLDLDMRARALSYFYHERMKDLRSLADNPSLETFFANEALGMSMEYGLRASLIRLERTLQERGHSLGLEGQPAFSRVVLVRMDGAAIADTRPEHAEFWSRMDLASRVPLGPRVVLEGRDVFVALRQFHKEQPKGWLIAQVNHQSAFGSLVYDETVDSATRIAVLVNGHVFDPNGKGLPHAAGLLAPRTGTNTEGKAGNLPDRITVMAAVAGTPFTLVAVHQPQGLAGYLTSRWFLGLMGLFSVLLLAGIAIANRIQKHTLILQGHMEESLRHGAVLGEQNAQLLEEVSRREASERLLERQANFDMLTGLPNRSLAMDRLSQALLQQSRHAEPVGVIMMDLDRFKRVNDTLGHEAGDRLLVAAGRRLREALRDSDTVARLGGDEFLIILPRIRRVASAERVCRKLLDLFQAPFTVENHSFIVSASLGVAIAPNDGTDVPTLLKHADIALYRSKDEGRNTYRFFTREMNESLKQRQAMENLLVGALARNEFHVVYQPIMDIRHGIIVGAEALLRWSSPEIGQVTPDRFIPLCEELGIISNVGAWVLSEACTQAAEWRRSGPFRIAVNLSSLQFRDPRGLFDVIAAELERTGLPPGDLQLEVTETTLLDDCDATWTILEKLNTLGVRLSIDDFGTGYSSMIYLRKFPFDTLKIDQTFVQDLPGDSGSVALARAIVALAKAMDMDVIAEGIETPAQLAFFQNQQCRFAQGYFFFRPMDASALSEVLRESARQAPRDPMPMPAPKQDQPDPAGMIPGLRHPPS